jgi:transposase
MLTWEEDVEAHALRERGWSISAIARHLGRDPKTIRAYLAGERTPGERRPRGEDHFEPFARYVAARFAEDVHVQAAVLFDELVGLGYPRSYQTFTRVVRQRGLRPRCEVCAEVGDRATIEIDHPPGAETQWDWVELPGAPWLEPGQDAHLLVGSLSFSSKFRAVFADSEEQPQTIDGLWRISQRLGGVTREWRFDRMSTVVHIGSDRILPSFAAVAKHFAVEVKICPPYRGNRKGVVESNIDLISQRWWRSAEVDTVGQAQASLDRFCERVGDARRRRYEGVRTTVAGLAELERLRELPARPFPAELTVTVPVASNATVAFGGNRYSVPPSLIGTEVVVRHRLGSEQLQVVTPAGLVVATHRRLPDGAGELVRTEGHRAQLERLVLAQAARQDGGRPCRRKTHRPPGEASKAEAARLRQRLAGIDVDDDVVVDLAVYARLVDGQTEEVDA